MRDALVRTADFIAAGECGRKHCGEKNKRGVSGEFSGEAQGLNNDEGTRKRMA